MPGLLDKIGGGIESLLGNEFVQGAAGAAAFGFNPLIGLLAGPGIKNDRERRELENELGREELKGLRSRRQGAEGLSDLLQSTRKQFVPPLGLLNVEGAPDESRLGSVGGFERSVPALQTPEGLAEAQGLLAQASPQSLAGLLGSGTGRAPPAVLRVADQIFGPADSPEKTKWIQENFGSAGSPLEAFLADQQRQLNEQRIREEDAAASEREREERDRLAGEQVFAGNLTTSIDDLIELSQINQDLAGGLQDPGLPGAEIRRGAGSIAGAVGDVAGFDTTDIKGDVAARDRFKKLTAAVSFDVLKDAELDRTTNQILEQFFVQLPGDIATPANALVIADQLEGRLRLADAKGIPIPNRAEIEQIIQQQRAIGSRGIGAEGGSGGQQPAFIQLDDGRVVPNPAAQIAGTDILGQAQAAGADLLAQGQQRGDELLTAVQAYTGRKLVTAAPEKIDQGLATLTSIASEARRRGGNLTQVQLTRARREIKSMVDRVRLSPEQRQRIDDLVVDAQDVSAAAIAEARFIIESAIERASNLTNGTS